MPIVLSHNQELDLNLFTYSGQVTFAELKSLAAFQEQNPQHLRRDGLSVLSADCHFDAVDLKALDALFSRYLSLYAPIDFQILRRSAWICISDRAREHLHYWLGGRDTKAMSVAVGNFDTLAEAADWLLLSASDIEALETGEGFDEIARFDWPLRAAVQPQR